MTPFGHMLVTSRRWIRSCGKSLWNYITCLFSKMQVPPSNLFAYLIMEMLFCIFRMVLNFLVSLSLFWPTNYVIVNFISSCSRVLRHHIQSWHFRPCLREATLTCEKFSSLHISSIDVTSYYSNLPGCTAKTETCHGALGTWVKSGQHSKCIWTSFYTRDGKKTMESPGGTWKRRWNLSPSCFRWQEKLVSDRTSVADLGMGVLFSDVSYCQCSQCCPWDISRLFVEHNQYSV